LKRSDDRGVGQAPRVLRVGGRCIAWALVAGTFLTSTVAGQSVSFYTVPPCRIVDTRAAAGPFGAPSLVAHGSRTFDIAGQCGVSTRAVSVSLNVTVVGPQSGGFFTLMAAGSGPVETSTLNFKTGETRANNAISALGPAGALTVLTGNPTGTADVILDVNGYFADATAESTTTAPPAFNPPPGTYTGPQKIEILSSTPSALIYYTTDGTTPSSTNGTLYTGAVGLPSSATLQAVATATGLADSPVSSGIYTLNLTSSLFLAQLTPQGASLSLGSGSGSLVLSADQASAVLHYQYSNLSGPIVAQHIHGPGGVILFDLDTSTPDSTGGRLWTLAPAGGLSVDQILAALFAGECYLNLHTAMYPSGEIKGFLNLSTGSITFTPPPPPPSLPPPPATETDAARFLLQATYGPSSMADISEITSSSTGYGPWFTNQFSQPLVSHLSYVVDEEASENVSSDQVMESFWKQAVTGPDQLRQRVALALSELMVISDQNSAVQAEGMARYLDVLEQDAFGNFRQLMTDVTLDPTMGIYLNMLGNDVGDPANGINPNENYAREIMQLFTIGLYGLNPDGTLKLDPNGLPVPTYNQAVVEGMAAVFTGWTFAGGDHSDPDNFYWVDENWRLPMESWPEHHSPGTKLLVDGTVLPAGGSPQQDLDSALDVLFNHPNVGPFACRQLIQRLVTSNPSPAYVYRCAQAFANNGSGVRGDMKAVLKAILLDYEARSATFVGNPGYGHLREPIVRFGHLMRALSAVPPSDGTWRIYYLEDPSWGLNQNPLRSPTVFNFFSPSYQLPGTLARAGLVAPEFEITTETSIFGTANFLHDFIYYGAAFDPYTILPDYEHFIALSDADLLATLNALLTGNALSSQTLSVLSNAMADPNFTDPSDPTTRVRNLAYLIILSPDYAVQR
jgi:uncharacterized protein (DUF1800 family)